MRIETLGAFFDAFLARREKPFTTDDFRQFLVDLQVEEPGDARTYGPIIRQAATSGKIVMVGLIRSRNPSAHRRPIRLWAKPRPKPAWYRRIFNGLR